MMRLFSLPTGLAAVVCLTVALGWAQPAEADFQLRAQQESTTTPSGTLRGTSLRAHWLASPGVRLGGGWFLRPGAEAAYGRFERGSREERFWEAGGIGQLNYPGESVGFYLQGGLGYIDIAGQNTLGNDVFGSNDVVSHVGVGIRIHEGIHLELGYRYRRFHDRGLSTQGIIIGLGF